MAINKIEIWDFQSAFRDGPYAMSHVTSTCAYGRILRVRSHKGLCGLGEIVFSPAVPSQDREERINDEDDYLTRLLGQPTSALLNLASEMRLRDKSWHGIAFGLETAWIDIEGRKTGQAAYDLLGGKQRISVPDYFSISESKLTDIRGRMDAAGANRTVFQLKLGMASLDHDIKQVSNLLKIMTAGQVLQADANGGWTVDQACRIMAHFDDHRLIWEEPCAMYEDNVRVAEQTQKKVMVDQCIGDLGMARRAIDENVAHSICIKSVHLGGLTTARQVRDAAIASKTPMRIDGPWCGDIASAAILHLAVGTPEDQLIAGCDLREPLTLPLDLKGVRHISSGEIAPPHGEGIGITLGDEEFGTPEKTILI